jgi:hypothetical protein
MRVLPQDFPLLLRWKCARIAKRRGIGKAACKDAQLWYSAASRVSFPLLHDFAGGRGK